MVAVLATVVTEAALLPVGKHLCMCRKISKPVCASDGISYGNECYFRCAKRLDGSLCIVHKGFCDEEIRGEEKGEESCRVSHVNVKN